MVFKGSLYYYLHHRYPSYLKSIASRIKMLLLIKYFAILTENCVYGDLELLMNQYPRFVPRFAPNFLQKYVVKRIKAKLGNQAKAQGIGRHSRYTFQNMMMRFPGLQQFGYFPTSLLSTLEFIFFLLFVFGRLSKMEKTQKNHFKKCLCMLCACFWKFFF